jgi:hypothetical protein
MSGIRLKQKTCYFVEVWYVTNHTLHKDLRIPQVQTVLQELIDTYRTALKSHPNPLMAHILTQPDSRRLQRRWTLDVIT